MVQDLVVNRYKTKSGEKRKYKSNATYSNNWKQFASTEESNNTLPGTNCDEASTVEPFY